MKKNNYIKAFEQKPQDKIAKWISYFVLGIFLLVLALLVVFYCFVVDKNRNNHIDNEATSSEIIKKNYIDGYKNTSSTGAFTFSIPEDDINQMLANGMKEIDNKKIESVYYSIENEHHYFYFDLVPKPITTRVVVDATPVYNNEECYIDLQVNSIRIGKLNAEKIVSNYKYLTSEFIDELSEKSLLPISYEEKSRTFKLEPLKLIDKMPSSEIGGSLLDYAKDNPEIISLNSSLFGFDIDYTYLRSSDYIASVAKPSSVDDFSAKVSTACSNLNVSLMSDGESEVIESLSIKELSKMIRYSNTIKDDEVIESTLTSNRLIYSLNDAKIIVKGANDLRLVFNVSINGYEIDVPIKLIIDPTLATMDFEYGFELSTTCKLGSLYINYAESLFEKLSFNFSFFTYKSTNKTLMMSFKEIKSSSLNLIGLDCSIEFDTVNLDKFNFIVTK